MTDTAVTPEVTPEVKAVTFTKDYGFEDGKFTFNTTTSVDMDKDGTPSIINKTSTVIQIDELPSEVWEAIKSWRK